MISYLTTQVRGRHIATLIAGTALLAAAVAAVLVGYKLGSSSSQAAPRHGATTLTLKKTLSRASLGNTRFAVAASTQGELCGRVVDSFGSSTACTAADAAEPLVMTSNSQLGSTNLLVVDPQRRLGLIRASGQERRSADGGLSAAISDLMDVSSVDLVDKTGRALGTVDASPAGAQRVQGHVTRETPSG